MCFFFTQSPFTIPSHDELPAPNSTITDMNISELNYWAQPKLKIEIDGIAQKPLKCASARYKPLSQQYVPMKWCLNLITPIHNSDDKSSVNNYRSFSLLCTISKVLEKKIYYFKIHVTFPIWFLKETFNPTHSLRRHLILLHKINFWLNWYYGNLILTQLHLEHFSLLMTLYASKPSNVHQNMYFGIEIYNICPVGLSNETMYKSVSFLDFLHKLSWWIRWTQAWNDFLTPHIWLQEKEGGYIVQTSTEILLC